MARQSIGLAESVALNGSLVLPSFLSRSNRALVAGIRQKAYEP